MSHPHTQKEKPKKIKQELAVLHETKERVEEAKIEMLRHNPLLLVQNPQEETPAPLPHSDYIKRTEDAERIAQHTSLGNGHTPAAQPDSLSLLQSNVQTLLDIQLQTLSAFTQSWLKLLGGFSAQPQNTEEPVA